MTSTSESDSEQEEERGFNNLGFPRFPGGKHVTYCGVTGFPLEYVAHTVQKDAGMKWWEENEIDELEAYLTKLEVSGETDGDTGASSKRAVKAAKKKANKNKPKGKQEILIAQTKRNKRKYITSIRGIDAFGVDLKTAAKAMGKKFACGAAVSKTADGGFEIVVQGDVAVDVPPLLRDTFDIPTDKMYNVKKGGNKKKVTVYE